MCSINKKQTPCVKKKEAAICMRIFVFNPDRPVDQATIQEETLEVEAERVCLSHGCYVCGSVLSTASATRNHIARIHGMYLPPREVGTRRPQENDCVFVPHDENRDSDHYACPSCWFHCPYEELDILNDHTLDEHDPQPIQDQDNERKKKKRCQL
ncbi:hypothetical protein BD770DRAFT_414849 [Pilaira anomala]|nr:hypothetical protein BD770DRAFT_414849 [Pilaira anomala]